MTLADRLAEAIDTLRVGQRVLVAFDGPDAAGKTTLAHAVADRLTRPSTCASIDAWHHPRDVRLRRGDESPEGYYLDSFDHDALVRECLQPFASGRRYERRYLPGQALYRQAAAPLDAADVLVDDTDPRDPRVLRWNASSRS